MKLRALLVLIAVTVYLPAAEKIVLPAKLPAYEEFIVETLQRGVTPGGQEGKIRVTVASGDGAIVKTEGVIEIPQGSSAMYAAGEWRKKPGGGLLIGWAQGLVVVRRKAGERVERVTWTQREARTEAPKFILQDGDYLIGLVYSDY